MATYRKGKMAIKDSDKIILSAKDSEPPPGYIGRNNPAFDREERFHSIHGVGDFENGQEHYRDLETRRFHDGKRVRGKKVESICLCTASVYPHYHGETMVDGSIYDEILILDPKELQQTSNKTVRLKGQCLRVCKLFALIAIVLAGLACALYGVAHFFIVNKGGEAVMTTGDVKLLQYSTYFCEGVTTESSEIERSIIVLKKRFGNIASFNYNLTKALRFDSGLQIYEKSFYAIEQGVLEMTVKSQEDVNILIFEEKSALDAWKANRNYAVYSFKRTCCKSVTTERGLYEFRAKQDRQAFLVVYSPIHTHANFSMRFKRHFIDYIRNDEFCTAKRQETCSVPLSFASDDKVVIEISRSSKFQGPKKIEWACKARIWFYVLVFAGILIIFIIIVCIGYCIVKYCFCDPCCCCFCCYIVPKEKEKPKVVQYHRNRSNLVRTPRGPRANHMRTLRASNESVANRGYTTSDTSDTESRAMPKRGLHMTRRDSEATTHSGTSVHLYRRRSSSIGSDIKRGMSVDESYEELPVDVDNVSKINGSVVAERKRDTTDGDARSKRKKKRKEIERKKVPKKANNHETYDDYLSDIEIRLRRKRAQFSDSDENESESCDDDDDDYDNTYDIVGLQMSDASKSTAEKIDSLPLGPSGAPPRAPPKSAASLKGKPGLNGVKNLENLEILPNGMTRVKTEKLHKSKSDAVACRERKQSPITPKIIVINGIDRKRSDIYGTYDRGRKLQTKVNGMYNRTISLDSGLDNIDGKKSANERAAADIKF